MNAQAQVYLAQQSYGNNLFLGVIALLASVALVNTLVMATVERRGALFLLRRVGATTRQLLSMTIWQTVILDLTGLILGVAAGAASVVVVSKQLAGTWMPYLTWPPMALIGATSGGTDDPRDPGADPVAARLPDPAGMTVTRPPTASTRTADAG